MATYCGRGHHRPSYNHHDRQLLDARTVVGDQPTATTRRGHGFLVAAVVGSQRRTAMSVLCRFISSSEGPTLSANSRATASVEVSHSSEEKFVTEEVVMVLWTVEREMEVTSGGGHRIGMLGLWVSVATPPHTQAMPWVRTRPLRASSV